MLNPPGGPFIKHHLKLKYTPGFFSHFSHILSLSLILPLGVGHPSLLAVLTQNSWRFKCFFSGIRVSSVSSDLGGRCFMDLTWESPQQAWLLDRQADGGKEWREEGEGWRRLGVGRKGGVWKHRTGAFPPLLSRDSGEEALQHASTDVVALSGAPAQRGASSH